MQRAIDEAKRLRNLEIEGIVEQLQKTWKKFPMLRLCQLLNNAANWGPQPYNMTENWGPQPYNMTDAEIKQNLEDYYERSEAF